MPYKVYHGKTGRIFNVTKRACGVIVNKQVKYVTILIYTCTVLLKSKLPVSSHFSRDEIPVSRYTVAAILEYITKLTFLARRKIMATHATSV